MIACLGGSLGRWESTGGAGCEAQSTPAAPKSLRKSLRLITNEPHMSQILINRPKNAHGQSITWAEKDRRSPSSYCYRAKECGQERANGIGMF
jgi:hypothetical protein